MTKNTKKQETLAEYIRRITNPGEAGDVLYTVEVVQNSYTTEKFHVFAYSADNAAEIVGEWLNDNNYTGYIYQLDEIDPAELESGTATGSIWYPVNGGQFYYELYRVIETPAITWNVSITFETWDAEDIEAGDTYNRGYITYEELMTLEEITDKIKEYAFTTEEKHPTWLTTIDPERNFQAGTDTFYSLFVEGATPADYNAILKAAEL